MRKIYSMLDWEDYIEQAKEYIGEYELEEGTDYDDIENVAMALCYDDWNNFYRPVLKNYFDNHICIVDGYAGAWNGVYYGGNVTTSFEEIENLLSDCWYFELYDNNGLLRIEGTHHDGRVAFDVKELTSKGYDWYRNYSDDWVDRDALRYMFDFNFNSRKPAIDWYL